MPRPLLNLPPNMEKEHSDTHLEDCTNSFTQQLRERNTIYHKVVNEIIAILAKHGRSLYETHTIFQWVNDRLQHMPIASCTVGNQPEHPNSVLQELLEYPDPHIQEETKLFCGR